MPDGNLETRIRRCDSRARVSVIVMLDPNATILFFFFFSFKEQVCAVTDPKDRSDEYSAGPRGRGDPGSPFHGRFIDYSWSSGPLSSNATCLI